ncbi:MAG: phospholipase A [Pseudomonadota bacterium]
MLIAIISLQSQAQEAMDACLLDKIKNADEALTIREIKFLCEAELTTVIDEAALQSTSSGLRNRLKEERQSQFDAFVITPHRLNYILPAYASNAINAEVYRPIEGFSENFSDVETQFQISFKVPLNEQKILFDNDGLYLGFTLEAWWQIYSENISKPFRETNYQPELFYIAPTDITLFGGKTSFMLGIEHQSNGRSQLLSRSWNRVYAGMFWEKGNLAISLKPWYRLEEDEKQFEFDPDGDDNPDIEDFYGKFELGAVYRWGELEFTALGRRNFSTKNGAIRLGLTFPLWGKLRGYAVGFDGYGDSLIDYNYKQTRFGLGIALNSFL